MPIYDNTGQERNDLSPVRFLNPSFCIAVQCRFASHVWVNNGISLRKIPYCTRRDCDNIIGRPVDPNKEMR